MDCMQWEGAGWPLFRRGADQSMVKGGYLGWWATRGTYPPPFTTPISYIYLISTPNMGKTRAPNSPPPPPSKRLRSSTKAALKPVEKPGERKPKPRKDMIENGTQTSNTEPGSYDDFREKVGCLFARVSAAVKKEVRGNGGVSTEEREGRFGCPACSECFDLKERLPICLPCGHSICQLCIPNHRSHTYLTCPLDYNTFDTTTSILPVNYLLIQIHDALYPPSELTCKAHHNCVLGYCENEEMLICGVCLFSHKDHNCCSLESEHASILCEERSHIMAQSFELAQVQLKTWTELEVSIGSLWQSLAMTPMAMSLNYLYYGQQLQEGSDQAYLMLISEDLNRLLSTVRELLDVLRYKVATFDRLLSTYREMPVSHQLALTPPSDLQLPSAEELFHSFSLLVERLNYCQNAQYMMPLAINQRF